MKRRFQTNVRGLLFALGLLCSTSCATMGMRSAVDLSVKVAQGTPGAALVYIDGRYIGSLAAVAARGVRLPEGQHRISIEKAGYFPYDVIVESDLQPISLEVELLKLPE